MADRLLVDGSLSNPMPVDVAIKAGAGIILAMGFDRPISLFDTGQFPYVIAEGERAAEAQLPYLRRLLDAAQ